MLRTFVSKTFITFPNQDNLMIKLERYITNQTICLI